MIKTLVSVDADLASSIALRYACQLADLLEMGLQPIHVKEPDPRGYQPGTGWVRRTWEKALWESGQEEIGRFIKAERISCPLLGAPKVTVGDRDDEILFELQGGEYDLFMEGTLSTFKLSKFHKLVSSKLFRYMPCPAVLVRNLVSLQRVTLLLGEEIDSRRVIPVFSKIFQGTAVNLELIYCDFQGSGPLNFQEKDKWAPEMHEFEEMLAAQGCPPRHTRVAQGSSETLSRFLRDYGLVAAGLHRTPSKKSPLLDLLGRVPSPILLCWV